MARKWMLGGLGVAALALAAVAASGPLLTAGKGAAKADDQDEPAKAAQLPVGRVVLFSSGVGYFQRQGTVEGSARVDLSFPASDINDLLKSMVLRDLDGGSVSAVSYDSDAPVERTLRSFAVNLTGNPGFADLLNQARGEKVEVAVQAAGAATTTLTGTVVGVERQRVVVNKEPVDVAQLNLWCADGMRGVKLGEVQRVRFLSPTMESEFRKALETLALSHDAQKKAVSIRFAGEGKRRVTVGYVVESPIWKTSYRLVLGAEKESKPYLQGWAVVENQTDEDWKDVRMALISGRPISFRMNLYTPLYVPRPLVEPELFASLRPVAYSGSMDRSEMIMDTAAAPAAMPPGAPAAGGGFGGGFAGRMPARGWKEADGDKKDGKAGESYSLATRAELAKQLDLGRSVASAASAAKLGDFFQYAIDKPVSLPRQKSALLPIAGKDVQAKRVSIYREATHAKFPLLGLKLKNTSGLHLMQGPITVFEGGNYAGDARIEDLQPGEERLLSYAVDLGTEVSAKPSTDSGRVVQVKAVKGVLWTTTKVKDTKVYTAKNRNDAERVLLVEHPVRNDFKLVGDAKPTETASDVYRFEVKVPAGASKELTVAEERTFGSTVQLSSTSDEQIRWFLGQTITSDKVKEGLREAMKLRHELAKTQREIAELQRQLNTITEDQGRLRANLREMPPTAKAYKRYLEKFDDQETQIEKLQADVKKMQGVEHSQKKEFDDFLTAFSAE